MSQPCCWRLDLTRRLCGRPAGFVAGLAFALTPISVAMARHNNPDELLILCCVAAMWCAVRGFQDGRTRWLAWCGALLGLGFETKMAVALFVVPGIASHGSGSPPRAGVPGTRCASCSGAGWCSLPWRWRGPCW